ncbi:hypothetical protein HMPREF0239_04728 [Clostridium sp. ATCC BAA-442]|nr:hypothetical protein HMPREF0239_04728 [Clostridium sp. ATCC BAA-442]
MNGKSNFSKIASALTRRIFFYFPFTRRSRPLAGAGWGRDNPAGD